MSFYARNGGTRTGFHGSLGHFWRLFLSLREPAHV